MTDSIATARLALLAQLLDTPPESLASLRRLTPAQLAALTSRLSDELFDALAPTFAKISKLAPLMPDSLVVSVAQKAIPAEVAGRAAGVLGIDHPDRIAGVLSRMRTDYLADAAVYVDPRVIPTLAPRVPAEALVPAARELLRRRHFAVAAHFLEFCTDDLIRALVQGIDDDEGLLHTAALIADADRVREILDVIPTARRNRIIGAAATGAPAATLAALSVIARLDSKVAAPLARSLFEACDDRLLGNLVLLAEREAAMPELIELSQYADDATINRLAQHPAFVEQSASGVRA
ncbi:hypothetical protein [Nocardia sp. NPDC050406]|uniref:hypothetical protein n=1 Tax=Nocardia sp. NPDC050406 TaxID=3364318 RepID=UPI0037950578